MKICTLGICFSLGIYDAFKQKSQINIGKKLANENAACITRTKILM